MNVKVLKLSKLPRQQTPCTLKFEAISVDIDDLKVSFLMAGSLSFREVWASRWEMLMIWCLKKANIFSPTKTNILYTFPALEGTCECFLGKRVQSSQNFSEIF